MNQADFRQLEAVCVRRRLLSAVMKLPCSPYRSLWFLLLLGTGSLLLLVRLQDLSETVQQQTPVVLSSSSVSRIQKRKLGCSCPDGEKVQREISTDSRRLRLH
ncbi:hypothetical protein PAMP_020200 [Pampus punctatissimus]